jgi:hypothetical protein
MRIIEHPHIIEPTNNSQIFNNVKPSRGPNPGIPTFPMEQHNKHQRQTGTSKLTQTVVNQAEAKLG